MSRSRPQTAKERASSGDAITRSLDPAERVRSNVRHFKSLLLKRPLPTAISHREQPSSKTCTSRRPFSSLRNHHQTLWNASTLQQRVAPQPIVGSGRWLGTKRELDEFDHVQGHFAAENPEDDVEEIKALEAEKAASIKPVQKTKKECTLKIAVASAESVPLRYMLAYSRLKAVSEKLSFVQLRSLLLLFCAGDRSEMANRGGTERLRVIRQAKFMLRAEEAIADKSTLSSILQAFDVFHEGWIPLRPFIAALQCILHAESSAHWLFYILTCASLHQCPFQITDFVTALRFLETRERSLTTLKGKSHHAARACASSLVQGLAMDSRTTSLLSDRGAVADSVGWNPLRNAANDSQSAAVVEEFRSLREAWFPSGVRDVVQWKDAIAPALLAPRPEFSRLLDDAALPE